MLIFGILMVILFALAVTPLHAGPLPPVAKPWGWKSDLLEQHFQIHLPDNAALFRSPGGASYSYADTVVPTATDWARLVFQSFRNDNWEIYIAGAKGQNPNRLTYHGASDIEPHLNKGATRIAFASNRDGNYEIYTMNPDGSDLRRLTFNSISDRRPMWSPDGSKIAFYACQGSGLDGCDVYVMNADGSNRRQLTSDGNSFDPGWSPDGQQIVFATYRGGQYGIWVMNADGTGAHPVASAPYAQHPVWSPDGRRIAYDADADGDGFNELMVFNTDGSGGGIVYNPGPGAPYYNEIWAASWLFDPDDGLYYAGAHLLAFTHLILAYYQGQWYWVEAYPMFVEVDCYGCMAYPLTDTQLDWHPMSQTMDNQPPVAWLAPLPPYSRYSDVRVGWRGEDIGLAGLAFYDVQVREGNGPWTDWKVWAYYETSDTYSGTSGQRVQFRVRAWDRAYNVSSWTPDAQAPATWLYAYEISGNLRDTRAIPVARSQISLTASLVGSIDLSPWGTYLAHLESGGATRLEVSAPGYGNVWPLTRTIDSDLRWNFYLPPRDNVVQNGDFENPDGLAGWGVGGTTLPTVITEAVHTGDAAVLLATSQEPQWGSAEVISGGVGSQPDMEVAPDGSVHIVYVQSGNLYYISRSAGGVWSEPVQIATSAQSPAVAVAPSGAVHMVWKGPEGVYYRQRSPEGTWGDLLLLRQDGWSPDIAVDGQGNAHVIYAAKAYQYGYHLVDCTFYISRTASGEWGTERRISNEIYSHTITANASGEVVIAVSLVWGVSVCKPLQQEPWECSGTSWRFGVDDLEIDSSGTSHVIGRVEGLYCMYLEVSPAGTPWLEQLSDCTSETSLAVEETGHLHMVNVAPTEHGRAIFWRYKPRGGTWSTPRLIVEYEEGGAPELEVGPGGYLHLFHEKNATTSIYRTGDWLPQAESSIFQGVALPDGLHQPTLSFLYRLEGWGESDPERFAVNITASGSTTTAFSTTLNTTDWTHQWVDLSPWAGEVITIAFQAKSQNHLVSTLVTLDEITIGSWLTPAPRAVYPNPVEAHVSIPITVTGENFLEGAILWIDGVPLATNWLGSNQLTATLPSTLSLGMHIVEVQNPGGQTTAVPDGLVVGRQIYLPLVLRRSFGVP
jgi:hypothetical protein